MTILTINGTTLASVCDGKEQDAFEAWAQSFGFDMSQHPLHYLFLNERTDAARDAWKAGLAYSSGIAGDVLISLVAERKEWPLRARVWTRTGTNEKVLEIEGTIGNTHVSSRHTQPLSVADKDMPRLPTLYPVMTEGEEVRAPTDSEYSFALDFIETVNERDWTTDYLVASAMAFAADNARAAMAAENAALRSALHDAIDRPKGVVPTSAEPFYDQTRVK